MYPTLDYANMQKSLDAEQIALAKEGYTRTLAEVAALRAEVDSLKAAVQALLDTAPATRTRK